MTADRPRLYTTPEGLKLARTRVRDESWAQAALKRLRESADKLDTSRLPTFETQWWESARGKNWKDIYPEINRHTLFAVRDPILRACDAAIAFTLTGETQYARRVRETLLHYTQYSFFAEHPDVGLNWSVWGMRALYAYDLVWDTLKTSDRERVDHFFRRMMQAVRKNDEWWVAENPGGRYNNHFAWHKLLIGAFGLFFDDPGLIDYAIDSDQGARDLIEHGSRDDGLWFESSLNYHFAGVIPLVLLAQAMRASGHPLDLMNQQFANGRRLRDLVIGPFWTVFPDRTLPTIGDAYGRRADLRNSDVYYALYDAFTSSEAAWLLKDRDNLPGDAMFLKHLPGKPRLAPSMPTRMWPEHGYIALRTQEGSDYWKGDGFSAFLSFDIDSVHSHRDKFDLMVFARGAHLAVDPEALSTAEHAFSSSVQNELNRSSVCHNTVMVDGKNTGGIAEKLEVVEFIHSGDVKLATIADLRARVYPGVKTMRTVAAAPEFVLDVFQCASPETHTYDYLFHTVSDSGEFDPGPAGEDISLGEDGPWKWIRSARMRRESDDWSISTHQQDLRMRFQMCGEDNTLLIRCAFPSRDTLKEKPLPMLIVRRRTQSTVFVSLLQAERGEIPAAKVTVTDAPHGRLRIQVQTAGILREFSLPRLEAPGSP